MSDRGAGARTKSLPASEPRDQGVRQIEAYANLAEAGIEPSVGSVGDSYDNALAETINGLFKAEVIHRRGPWRHAEAVEFATLEWVDWFNHRRSSSGVRALHHGLGAGDDDYGDVDLVVQIGGPFAPPSELARLASAESGRLVETAKPVRQACVGLLADGTGVQFERLAYEDAAAQTVHAGIYDQSFVQGGLGRGRGINRSASTPLEIRILGNVPLPVPIHSIDRWRPINRIAKMLLRGAVHLNAADMHCFYPDLFPSPDAAAQATHRWNGRAAVIAEVQRPARQFPEPTDRRPNGQGFKMRQTICLRSHLAAVHAEALREFPAGLAAWTVAPSLRAPRRRHPYG